MVGRLLVTGASGFVGKALSAHLSRMNRPLRLASRTPFAPESVVVDDVGGSTDWELALDQCDTVAHLAARVHVMNEVAVDSLQAFRAVNVAGSLNLARQAAAKGVKRFVFVSSVKVNGEETLPGQAFVEGNAPAPKDAYGQSKHEAEQGLRKIAIATGMEVVIVRPPLVYGPGAKANFAALVRAVRKGYPLPLGAINNLRSLVALDNLVDFIVTCTAHPLAANQTFIVSDGHDLSTAELVQGLARAAGVRARLFSVPVWALKAGARLVGKTEAAQRLCSNLQVDSSKARQLLDWVPPVSVDEALQRAVAGRDDEKNI